MKSRKKIRAEIARIDEKIESLNKPEDENLCLRLVGARDALQWALKSRSIVINKYLPVPELGFNMGRFSCGIGKWSYGWIFSTDCYGQRGIDLYVGTWFQLWILWDANKYKAGWKDESN